MNSIRVSQQWTVEERLSLVEALVSKHNQEPSESDARTRELLHTVWQLCVESRSTLEDLRDTYGARSGLWIRQTVDG
jgi:hypothetical protein